jgi:hypothetical protein
MRSAIENLTQCAAALTTLDLTFTTLSPTLGFAAGMIPIDVLMPIARLRHSLSSLRRVRWTEVDSLTPLASSHIDLYRSLPLFTELDVGQYISPDGLNQLEADPPPQHLKLLDLHDTRTTICSGHETGMQRLPLLTSFEPSSLRLFGPSFIRFGSLSQLEVMRLICGDVGNIPILIAAVSRCAQLTTLQLLSPLMALAELERMLTPLMKLRHLAPKNMHAMGSLDFLARSARLPRTLRSLKLDYCTALTESTLADLHALVNLEEWTITFSFDSAALEEYACVLTAAKLVWPHINKCTYESTLNTEWW